MARLNVPSVAPESIESLKRRFIRQNRDIARVNSTQSLRIRDLENEVSKLLSENLSLREQILRLQCDQEARQIQRLGEQTSRLKEQLESKLLEISAIISDFSQESIEKKTYRANEEESIHILKTPGEKWKDTYQVSQTVVSPDERLPPILEDETSQICTSEDQDIINIITTTDLFASESPDIGSPPTSQFVDADPVKIEFPHRDEETPTEELERIDPILSSTVEQRKKRKDSSGPAETKQLPSSELRSEFQDSTRGTFKSGAKRKLCAREEEEKLETMIAMTPKDGNENSVDEFKYAKVTDLEASETKTVRDITTRRNKDSLGSRGSRDKNNAAERKVLAPKSVNTSQNKMMPPILLNEIKKPILTETQRAVIANDRDHKSPALMVSNTGLSEREFDEPTELIGQADSNSKPKTPASSNQLQTSSTQLSNTRAKAEDTPPPSDLGLQADGSRPSRRVRGGVSYAEPNLRHKMRRPTKELADAVARDKINQASHSLKPGEEVDNNIGPNKASKNKAESEDDLKETSVTVPFDLSSCLAKNRKPNESLVLTCDDSEKLGTTAKGQTPSLNNNEEKPRSLSCNLLESESKEAEIWEGLSRRRRRSALAIRAGVPLSKEVRSLQSTDILETRLRVSS